MVGVSVIMVYAVQKKLECAVICYFFFIFANKIINR